MSHYEMTPDGRAVLICQVCKGRCHPDGAKEVYQDSGGGNYRIMRCPVCCCHECVQLADDPIRRKVAPQMLDQTQARPFSIENAARALGGILGLQPSKPDPPRRLRHSSGIRCDCSQPAQTRCLTCNEPMCKGCMEFHIC